MSTAAVIFVFALSGAVAAWAIWMFVDWIAHGCPDRFTVEETSRRWER